MKNSKCSFHADRFGSSLFASLWANAWGDEYPSQVAPFSSCTHRLLHQLDDQLSLSPGDTVVDLGCGTGGVGLWLAHKKRTRLIGLDRCSDATSIATRRTHFWLLDQPAYFVTGDFCQTGLASVLADAVISIDSLPAAQDIEGALREIHRILRPNGKLVFTSRELSPTSRHYEKLRSSWCSGLDRYGFSLLACSERPGVSGLWHSLYTQWLKHESDLRKELNRETVDALVSEARQGIPKMNDPRLWYLITAAAIA